MSIEVIDRATVGLPATARGSWMATPVRRLVLHHEAGSSVGRSGWRGIYRFHTRTRGWQDIGYQWGYCPSTREFYEGRGAGRVGAHVQGYNIGSHGLCVLGDYDRSRPEDHVIADLAAFARWHEDEGHGPGEFTHGHRDLGQTSCPGDHLYPRIPDINALARSGPEAPAPDPIEEAAMATRLVHLDSRGGTAYWPDAAARRLVPLTARWQADALAGDGWHEDTVVVDRADVQASGWTIG